jgi:hypothetical protein
VATVEKHLRQAEHNEHFLATLDLASTPYLDWALTIIFYAALHYLRALFSHHHLTNITRYGEMDNAFARLPVCRRNPDMYQDYRQLKDDSRAARYDMWRPTLADVVDYRDGELRRIRELVRAHLTSG